MSFEGVVGHGAQLGLLRRWIQEDRASGTYLFCGPEHVGKTTVAEAFAKALLCEKGGCDACRSCEQVRKGEHPDWTVLAPKGAAQRIRMEQITHLHQRFHLASFHGGWRVAMLQQADLLHLQSAPALLKLLEEPPARSVFILISHNEEEVLPTLRSRARLLRFFPVSAKELKASLGADVSEDIAGLWQGLPGMVHKLRDGQYLSMRDTVLGLLEKLREGMAATTLHAVAEMTDLVKAAGDAEAQKRAQRDMLKIMEGLLRDVCVLRWGEVSLLHEDCRERLAALAQRWRSWDMQAALTRCAQTREDLELNVSFRLCLERLLFSLPNSRPVAEVNS